MENVRCNQVYQEGRHAEQEETILDRRKQGPEGERRRGESYHGCQRRGQKPSQPQTRTQKDKVRAEEVRRGFWVTLNRVLKRGAR